MQRIRVGLTGLAVVFVIVLVATAFLTRFSPSVEGNVVAAAGTSDEPLADLGMAPGAPELTNEQNAVVAVPLPPGKP